MKNLNICIDIDGTITDPYYFMKWANMYFGKEITEDNMEEYYIHKLYGVSEEEFGEFYEKYKWDIHTHQKLRNDVKVVLRKLNLQHNLYFVTAREKSLRMLTYGYLRKNEIPFDKLFLLGTHHKAKIAGELECDIFIEDSYENSVELSKAGFKVLLLDTNYNRFSLHDNTIRVQDWAEIYTKINKLLLQTKAM